MTNSPQSCSAESQSDIVERLLLQAKHSAAESGWDEDNFITHEAASEIERLRRDITVKARILTNQTAEIARLTCGDAQGAVVWGPTQEDVVAHAIMLDDGCGLTVNGQRVLCDDPRAMEQPERCYCRRSAKAALTALAAQTPAALVDLDSLVAQITPENRHPELPVSRLSAGSAIAALAKRFWSVHPKEIQDLGITREQFYEREMLALFASLNEPQPAREKNNG